MACGESFVKYVLFVLNLIFVIAGLALLGLGIAAQLHVSSVSGLSDTNVVVAPVLVMVVGAVVFLISFFGCCGAIKENAGMLITYCVLMVILMTLKIALSSVILVSLPQLDSQIPKIMEESFESGDRTFFHELEEALECCGTKGQESYYPGGLPASCCPSTFDSRFYPCNAKNAFEGCNNAVIDLLDNLAYMITMFTLTVAAVELVAVIFGCYLVNSVRNKYQTTLY